MKIPSVTIKDTIKNCELEKLKLNKEGDLDEFVHSNLFHNGE